MSKYEELLRNKPVLEIKENAKEVIFTTISAMCDNQHSLRFKKNDNDEFKISGCGQALSNWQMKFDRYDLEWSADEQAWDKVVDMINSGTAKIASVRSR